MQSISKLPKDIDFRFETERLMVRLLREEDRDFFVALHTDEKIMKHNGGKVDNELANKKFNTAIKYNKKNTLKAQLLTITDKNSNDPIGFEFLLQSKQQQDAKIVEIGIMLERFAQGKLMPEEAFSGLLTYLFIQLDLEQAVAQFNKANLATKRFVTKLGFNFEDAKQQSDTCAIYYKKADWLNQIVTMAKQNLQ